MSGLTILRAVGPSPEQWDIVIAGMRWSWSSQDKSDSTYFPGVPAFVFGDADRALALRLACLGDDHGKTLRMLPVIVDIKAPGFWFRQFDTYRVGVTDNEPSDDGSGVTQNSTSMMHTLGSRAVTIDDFHFEDPHGQFAADTVRQVNDARLAWIDTGKRKGPQAAAWRQLQEVVPYAWLYTRTVSLNYQVLRSMYQSRKHHRLGEWRTFCDWCATLEYSELITREYSK